MRPQHPAIPQGKFMNGLQKAVDALGQIHDPALVARRWKPARHPTVNMLD